MPLEPAKPVWQEEVERVHTEHKAWRSGHTNEHRDAEKQRVEEQRRIDGLVGGLQKADELMASRLEAGAKAFSVMEKQIEQLNAKISWPMWKVLTTAVSVFSVAGALIWAAARYPDRDEFRAIQTKVNEMTVEQALQRQTIGEMKSTQEQTNVLLTTLLRKP